MDNQTIIPEENLLTPESIQECKVAYMRVHTGTGEGEGEGEGEGMCIVNVYVHVYVYVQTPESIEGSRLITAGSGEQTRNRPHFHQLSTAPTARLVFMQ